MNLRSFGITDLGQRCPQNEDALLLAPTHGLYAVADGMGGLPGGQEASSRLIEMLQVSFSKGCLAAGPNGLIPATESIDIDLRNEFFANHPLTGACTTLTLAYEFDQHLNIAHIGDSAAYRVRGNTLTEPTNDHTMESQSIKECGEEARDKMPIEYSHTLTQCIGILREIEVDKIEAELAPGNRISLCTGGLSRVVNDDQMKAILSKSKDSQSACEEFVESANSAGGPDNITVIALYVD